jgi:hypothetical protein
MTSEHDQKGCSWTRFSDYVFVEGSYIGGAIAPAPGAMIVEYNPWADYRLATRGYAKQPHLKQDAKGEPAYLTLWRFGRQFESWDASPETKHDPELRAAILDFVRASGLLGLFHHNVIQVGRSARDRVWARSGAHWYTNKVADWFDSPVCFGRPSEGGPEVTELRFSDIAGDYFSPKMPRRLPPPTSPEFFINYREHTEHFLMGAFFLSRAIDKLREGDTEPMDLLRADISRRLKPVPDAEKGEPSYEDEPIYPSLLAALADMAARDVALGRFSLRACTECGNELRTNFHRTVYCSEQCRWKAAQRAHRQKAAQRAAKRTAKGGRKSK